MSTRAPQAVEVVGYEIESDELVGGGGFLSLRRLRMRNRRADGSLSDRFLVDFVVRPVGLDAVVVVVWRRVGDEVEVLVRYGLRPAAKLGRQPSELPLPDRRDYLFVTELVAGILEAGDDGEEGICRRAAAEVFEEAGYRVADSAVELLGGPVFPTPGSMPEKFWLAQVEVQADAVQQALGGDGSPLEEGASTEWLMLEDAIQRCMRGDIEDAKTELGLRRLRDWLLTALPAAR